MWYDYQVADAATHFKLFADVAQSVERRLGKTKMWRFAGVKNN